MNVAEDPWFPERWPVVQSFGPTCPCSWTKTRRARESYPGLTRCEHSGQTAPLLTWIFETKFRVRSLLAY